MAGGTYPTQSAIDDGLTRWIADDESLINTDVVLWYVFVRNDLREDLFRIDAIKTMPLAGHAIVWGEILGAWTALALIEVVALLIGAIALVIAVESPRRRRSWVSRCHGSMRAGRPGSSCCPQSRSSPSMRRTRWS